jgi:hypothetical protein
VFSLQGKDASELAGNRFQLLMHPTSTVMSDYIIYIYIYILSIIPKVPNKDSHASNIFKNEKKFEKRTNFLLYFTGD